MSDTGDITPEERQLLAELNDALGTEPLPAGFVEACEALVTWADIDHELAALLEEGAAEPVGARGAAPTTAAGPLVFEIGDGAVLVEVDIVGHGIEGRLLPAERSSAVLEQAARASAIAAIDATGRFRFAEVHAGPTRLRFEGGPSPIVLVTDWFVV